MSEIREYNIDLMHFSQAYFYVRAPYTNLCSCGNNNKECPVPDTSYENVQLIGGGEPIPKVETSSEVFYYCNQFVSFKQFPPIPSVQVTDIWMSGGQERLTRIYGWTSLVLLILYCVVVLGRLVMHTALSIVKGDYKVRYVRLKNGKTRLR
jgi:hypothetical protein